MAWSEWKPMGNPYLRFNEETGNVEALNENGDWVNLCKVSQLPLKYADYLFINGILQTSYKTVAMIQDGWTAGGSVNVADNKINLTIASVTTSWRSYGYYWSLDVTNYKSIVIATDLGELSVDVSTIVGTHYFCIVGWTSKSTSAQYIAYVSNYINYNDSSGTGRALKATSISSLKTSDLLLQVNEIRLEY